MNGFAVAWALTQNHDPAKRQNQRSARRTPSINNCASCASRSSANSTYADPFGSLTRSSITSRTSRRRPYRPKISCKCAARTLRVRFVTYSRVRGAGERDRVRLRARPRLRLRLRLRDGERIAAQMSGTVDTSRNGSVTPGKHRGDDSLAPCQTEINQGASAGAATKSRDELDRSVVLNTLRSRKPFSSRPANRICCENGWGTIHPVFTPRYSSSATRLRQTHARSPVACRKQHARRTRHEAAEAGTPAHPGHQRGSSHDRVALKGLAIVPDPRSLPSRVAASASRVVNTA